MTEHATPDGHADGRADSRGDRHPTPTSAATTASSLPPLQVLGDAAEGFCTDDGCFLPNPPPDAAAPA